MKMEDEEQGDSVLTLCFQIYSGLKPAAGVIFMIAIITIQTSNIHFYTSNSLLMTHPKILC